ncbi:hypothetical protein EDF56_11529 [Novosphingobium sp. PhB165]|nr:hypothetical protein EDF56_11529 [Novosphingobium sp. PhB165]
MGDEILVEIIGTLAAWGVLLIVTTPLVGFVLRGLENSDWLSQRAGESDATLAPHI